MGVAHPTATLCHIEPPRQRNNCTVVAVCCRTSFVLPVVFVLVFLHTREHSSKASAPTAQGSPGASASRSNLEVFISWISPEDFRFDVEECANPQLASYGHMSHMMSYDI